MTTLALIKKKSIKYIYFAIFLLSRFEPEQKNHVIAFGFLMKSTMETKAQNLKNIIGTKINNNNQDSWWKHISIQNDNITKFRTDFPLLTNLHKSPSQSLIYLDSAATSQIPTCVTNKLINYYQNSHSNVHRGVHYLSQKSTSEYENARDIIASFVNAYCRNEIIFTSGATDAINLVAHSYGRYNLKRGDEIILSQLEHHSNIVPWQLVSKETGSILKYIPIDKKLGSLDLEAFEKLITKNTKIICVTHISNVLGCITPIQYISSIARSKGHEDIKILVDACQSVPHKKINVQDLDIDFLVASGHKMCGPTGIGFLWSHKILLDSMYPYKGGGEMILNVYDDYSSYANSPSKFEAGTPPIAQAIALGTAIEYLTSIDMDKIKSYEYELTKYLLQRLNELPEIQILGPPISIIRGSIVSFLCHSIHASDIGMFLDLEGIAIRVGHHCCQPLHRAMNCSQSARVSLYFYNTKKEIDIFIEKLTDTIKTIKNIR